jgi:hypothetical protein
MTDILNRAADNLWSEGWDEEAAAVREAAEEILRLRKRIAVMEMEKSLADACLTSGYVRQTFETGTGDFSKFQGKKDE